MADFDLSMIVHADASEATNEGRRLEQSLEGVSRAEREAAAAADALNRETTQTGAAARSAAAGVTQLANAEKQQTAAARTATQAAGAQKAGYAQLGFQIQDISQQLALGVNPLIVLAQQGGQTASALQMMGGTGAGVARFFAGPWGSAIIAATTVVGMFALNMDNSTEAMSRAEVGANALGDAQSVLAGIFDMTSGRIEHQNALLIANARLTAINLRADALEARASAQRTFTSGLQPRGGALGSFLDSIRGADNSEAGARLLRPHIERIRAARSPEATAAAIDRALRETEAALTPGVAGSGTDPLRNLSNITSTQWRQALIDFARAQQNENIAGQIDQSLNSGTLAPGLRRDRSARTRQPRQDRSAERLEEFGEDAADRIAGIAGRFTDQPKILEQVRAALSQIDDLVDDIEQRRPPNWESLVAQAREARAIVQDAVNRPYREFVEQTQEQLEIQHLITQGRESEAQALLIINRLEEQGGALSNERKAAILAGVEALEAEGRQQEINNEKQQKYLQALDEVRSTITDTIASGFSNIEDVPRRLSQAFNRLSAEFIFENLFGDAFRRIEDRIRGETTAEDAANKFREAVERADVSTTRAASSLDRLAASADAAAGSLPGGVPGAPTPAPEGEEEIVVTGSPIPRDPRGFMEYVFRNVAEGVLGRQASQTIGRVVGQGLEGAAIGGVVGSFMKPLGKALGFKTSQTGAQIGGAIGSFIPIPGGEIIGAIVGSIAGGLLKKTPKASSTVTSVFDDVTATGSKGLRGTAQGLGSSVQEGLLAIADTLGGIVGDFAVSIGIRNKSFRVDPSGRGATKTSRGAVDFGDDQAAAISFAIMDAIADGAVTGLSPAVAKALQSSKDIDRALREALKVQNLEDLIEGIGGKIGREFSNFDKLAAERVRLAKKYGLDLLKVEEINAKERADLIKDITESRIGSAQAFLKDLKFGNLFEGDASTRRGLIMDEIAATQIEAEAGIDGAADRLTNLYRQLIETSKEAFGTAGPELTTDRASAQAGVERVIEMENARIAEAAAQQQAQTDALNQGNVLTNETNGLLAIANSTLAQILATTLGGEGAPVAGGAHAGGASTRRFTDLNIP